MPEPAAKQSLFAQAMEIPAWLEADRDTAYDDRLHRDRHIAATLGKVGALPRVRSWWDLVRQQASFRPTDTELTDRLVRGRRLISLVLIVLGIIAGSTTALAVFHYDGAWPVNVVTVLATLVLLQLALIVLTLILMLPRVPGVGALQDLLGSFNPGALAATLYRRIRRVDDSRASVLVWHEARGPAASRFARWQMLAWSQCAAVAFNVAALLTAIGMIAFTDLAFGWSTTLRLDTPQALHITNAFSLPWQQIWPDAVPSAALIEASRFYRLASAPPAHISAVELTGWWPFLLAAIVTYGLLPRILLLIIATLRLHSATQHLLLDDPRVRALLDRMGMAEIQLGSAESEDPDRSPAGMAAVSPSAQAQAIAIVWSNALPRDAVRSWSERHLQRRVSNTFEAGADTLAEDESVIEQVAGQSPAAILIFVRAWEAPLLDLSDFIAALRASIGKNCSLIVVPVAVDLHLSTQSQRETWSRWTARLADPALYLEGGA
jgi:Protein of unknown function (DUF2868)